MSADRPPRLIVANVVNELMLARPVPSLAAALTASAARKTWLAAPGDLVVIPHRPGEPFLRYVARVTGVPAGSFDLLATGSAPTESVPRAVLAEPALLGRCTAFASRTAAAELLCYALDRPAVELARALGLRPAGYAAVPGPAVLRAVYDLNTKSGFRTLAERLRLPIVPGRVCHGAGALRDAVDALLADRPAVRVKLDRASNGFGQATVPANPAERAAVLDRFLAACAGQPAAFVVEDEVAVSASPSVEYVVTDDGPEPTYPCLQRYRDGRFAGMVADERGVAADALLVLHGAATRVGRYLHGAGYRGVFDLDAVVAADGRTYCTEVNVRRTAGTFVHDLVTRLAGPGYARDRVWVADSVRLGHPVGFAAAVTALRADGLEYDPAARAGVVVTSDGVERDGVLRYLVVAATRAAAEATERAVERAVGQVLDAGTAAGSPAAGSPAAASGALAGVAR